MREDSVRSVINGVAVSALLFYLVSPLFGWLVESGQDIRAALVWQFVFSFVCILAGAYYAGVTRRLHTVLICVLAPLVLSLPVFVSYFIQFRFAQNRVLAGETGWVLAQNVYVTLSSLGGGILAGLVLFAARALWDRGQEGATGP